MKLIVFDLDFTLWDAGGTWCDHTKPPYRLQGKCVLDSQGRKITLYNDVRNILKTLSNEGYQLALASRTWKPEWAGTLLELFGITEYFDYSEIYPSSKLKHFRKLHEASGIAYNEMVFFDDEMRNIDEVGSLGVRVCFVENGITKSHITNHF